MANRRTLALAFAVFCFFQGLYGLTAAGRVDHVADTFEVYLQTESLWDRGSLAIPQGPPGVVFGRVGRDGKPYAPYGPLTAFAALPHHAVARAIAAAGVPRERAPAAWAMLVAAITSLASATWAALAIAGTFVAARAFGASEARALAIATLLGAASLLWPYGTVFYSEGLAAAFVAWALAAEGRGKRGWAALAIAALLLVKVSNTIVWPAFAALAFLRARSADPAGGTRGSLRAVVPYALAALAAGSIHAAWNAHRFGDAFQFGYDWSEFLRPGEKPRAFLLSELPRGLFGLLLSPGKSLLLYAPPVVLACWRIPAAWRERRPLATAWTVGLASSLLFYGSYLYWEGGYAFGPRHLVPLLPLLVLPLACGPAPRRAALVCAAVVGIAVQLLGVSVSFLEDQALGQDRSNQSYYEIRDDVPAGRALNHYRLDYEPFTRYPRLLHRHLTGAARETIGFGVELLPLHLDRVRRLAPGATAIPAALPWAIWAVFLLPLGWGGLALARARRGRGAAAD